MITDVVEVAWRAVGSPDVGDSADRVQGTCARCGADDRVLPVRRVVSRNFTGYSEWRQPWRPGLCRPCSWAYQTPLLRAVPHSVTRFPELLAPMDAGQLTATLDRPLAPDVAVVVPLRPGRKHVISSAAWGHIATDDALLTWTADDAARLQLLQQLRDAGFPDHTLTQPAPPYRFLKQVPAGLYDEVLDWWTQLEPWRSRPAWLQVACRTRTALPAAA